MKKKLIAATMSMLLALVLLVGTTFAWFTISNYAEVTGIHTVMQSAKNMEIAMATTPTDTGEFESPAEVTRDDADNEYAFGGVVTKFEPAVLETVATVGQVEGTDIYHIASAQYDKNGRTADLAIAKYPEEELPDIASDSDCDFEEGIDYYLFNAAKNGATPDYRKAAAAYYVWLRTDSTGYVTATAKDMQIATIRTVGQSEVDTEDDATLIDKAFAERDIFGRLVSNVTNEQATGKNEISNYYGRVGVAFRVADMTGTPTDADTATNSDVTHVKSYNKLATGTVLASTPEAGVPGYIEMRDIESVYAENADGTQIKIDVKDLELVNKNEVPVLNAQYEFNDPATQLLIKESALYKYKKVATNSTLTINYSDYFVSAYEDSMFGEETLSVQMGLYVLNDCYYVLGEGDDKVYYFVDKEDLVITSGGEAWDHSTLTDLHVSINPTQAYKYPGYTDASQLLYKTELGIEVPSYYCDLGKFDEDVAVLVEVIVYLEGEYTYAAYTDTATAINLGSVIFENQDFSEYDSDDFPYDEAAFASNTDI